MEVCVRVQQSCFGGGVCKGAAELLFCTGVALPGALAVIYILFIGIKYAVRLHSVTLTTVGLLVVELLLMVRGGSVLCFCFFFSRET